MQKEKIMLVENKRGSQESKPKRKTAGNIIEPYVRRGLSDSEIAEKTGIKYGDRKSVV